KQPAGALPWGVRKGVELGRALAVDPKVLLLDEPMGGMNQEEKDDIARFILDINSEWGTTIILIEHDMDVVMDISHRVAVLDNGRNIAEGTPHQVQNNPDVIRAYLGAGRARWGEAASTITPRGRAGPAARPNPGAPARRSARSIAASGRACPGRSISTKCAPWRLV